VADWDAAGGEFGEELGGGVGGGAVAGDDYGPLQIFAEFFFADGPETGGGRGWVADLDYRPMAGEGEGGGVVGWRAAEDEVIVAVYEDAYHFCFAGVDALGQQPKAFFRG